MTRQILAATLLVGSMAQAQNNSATLPRSTPEAQGVSSAGILAFVDAADQQIDSMNSFMLVRHGHVVAEGWWTPYDAKTPHILYSLTKSFTSTAVGLAIAEGKLSLDDPVIKFFPEDAPAEPSNNLKEMRIRDLLRMATGHQDEPRFDDEHPWTKSFLAAPVPFKPGTHFLYNTAGSYMLSAIVQKVTGQTEHDYLQSRLFEPLGFEDPVWLKSPQGVSVGGWGLSIRTEEIAKFGLMYLQKGRFGDKQIIPQTWVEEATSRQTSNGSNPNSDWDQGYGYQFWRCKPNCYRGDGAFGQFCIVVPQADAVIAITSGTSNMGGVMNLVWDKILPAMKPQALPQDAAANEKLKARLANLSVKMVPGKPTSPTAQMVSGKVYALDKNEQGFESIALDFAGPDGPVLTIKNVKGETTRLPIGLDAWPKPSPSALTVPHDGTRSLVSACGAWTAENTFTIKAVMPETPYHLTMVFKFENDQLTMSSSYNVGFGPTTQPTLSGRHVEKPAGGS